MRDWYNNISPKTLNWMTQLAIGAAVGGMVVLLVFQFIAPSHSVPRAEALLPTASQTPAPGASPGNEPAGQLSLTPLPTAPGLGAGAGDLSNGSEAEVPPETQNADLPAVKPTFSWVNAFSLRSTLDGRPVPVGAVITAYDPQGTVVGRSVVEQEGRYGLMALYQDDPATREDEGAVPGDVLTFTINGIPAQVAGPDEPVWVVNLDLLQLDLIAP